MTRPVLLDNVEHADLRVDARRSAELGDGTNLVLVFPTEFEELQREHPILFRKTETGRFQAVALLGLDKGENLFLDGDGGWRARHVPAVIERGPFLIGFREQLVQGQVRREPMVHVDLDHPRVGAEGGEPLFLPHGGAAPALERVTRALQTIHLGTELAEPMYAALDAAGLIEPVALDVRLSDREGYTLPGFHTVSADRLARLDGASLERLNAAGWLRLAYLAASSVGNIGRLIDWKLEKRRRT